MNAIDIAIAVVLGIGLIYGFVKGFVRIAVGVAGLAATLALALRWADRGTSWFGGIFASPEIAVLAAFAAVLAAGLVVTALVAWIAHRLVDAAQISWIDRIAGGAVGFGGTALMLSGLFVSLVLFAPPTAGFAGGSRLAPLALRLADVAATVLPERLADLYRERRVALTAPLVAVPSPTPKGTHS